MRSITRRVVCLMLVVLAGTAVLPADEKPRMIEGWGKFVDPAFDSKVELDKDVLVMTAPDTYVDNFNKTTAPRVVQDVSGDFAAEVTVLHVDPSKPNSVHKSLGDFPVACHSGTLLIRQDDRNFVRFEHMNDCRQAPSSKCYLHVYQDGKRVYHNVFSIKDVPTRMVVERHGNVLSASFTQENGKTWVEFAEANVEFLPKNVEVGVSMTSNTETGCTVKFRDFKITTAK